MRRLIQQLVFTICVLLPGMVGAQAIQNSATAEVNALGLDLSQATVTLNRTGAVSAALSTVTVDPPIVRGAKLGQWTERDEDRAIADHIVDQLVNAQHLQRVRFDVVGNFHDEDRARVVEPFVRGRHRLELRIGQGREVLAPQSPLQSSGIELELRDVEPLVTCRSRPEIHAAMRFCHALRTAQRRGTRRTLCRRDD